MVALIAFLIRQLKNRVNVTSYKNGNPLYDIAFVTQSSGNMAEAYQPIANSKISIGRVKMIDDDEKALVQVLVSDPDDDSLEPIYSRCGYLDNSGFIYEQKSKNSPAIKIGYLAKPSNPDVPCMKGERSWRSFWLHSYLDVYKFNTPIDPNPKTPYEPKITLPARTLNITGGENDGKISASNNVLGDGLMNEADTSRHDQTTMTRDEIIRDIKRNMVLVQGSTFRMGSEPSNTGVQCEDGKERGKAENNESPVHEVTLTDYFIGRFPVSQAEWKAIMEDNPSDCQDSLNYPVAPVSWNDCQKFIDRLNELSGEKYSLPTEAQWEFAARGGKLSKGTTFSGSEVFSEVGWSDHKHEVALKKSNELGIFDMSGLVREWCIDRWGHYSADAQFNPSGPDDNDPLLIVNTETSDELYYVVRSPSGNETVCNRKGEAANLGKDFKSYGMRLAISIPIPEQEIEPETELTSDVDPDNQVMGDTVEVLATSVVENDITQTIQETATPQTVETESEETEQVLFEREETGQETTEEHPVVLNGWGNRDLKKKKEENGDNIARDSDEKMKSDGNVENNIFSSPSNKAQANRLSQAATLVARCDKQGLSNVIIGGITTESRAGAYALFAILNKRKKTTEEAFSAKKHNWRDTALLSALLYCFLYIALYVVVCCVLQRPIIGRLLPNPLIPVVGIAIMYLFYFVIWSLVWSYKVERTESGNTFQPILDLLNKSVGQSKTELLIIIFGFLAIPGSLLFFECDFVPLLLVILTGVIINRCVPGVSEPWHVRKSYQDLDQDFVGDDDNEEPETNEPPAGNLVCTYDWVLDCDYKELKGHHSIHFDPDKMREERLNNPFYTQHVLNSKDVVKSMYSMLVSRKDYMERTRDLAKYISRTAQYENLNPEQTIQFALDFIQEPNIRFVKDSDSEKIQYSLKYMRLPDETLVDKEGDHDCKTFLAAMLYHALGYNVLFLYSQKYDHYAVAVEVKDNWTKKWGDEEKIHIIEEADIKYVICETTTDRFKVGDLHPGLKKEDFSTILLPCNGNEPLNDETVRTYDWDLDSEDGVSNRHGMIVLNFSNDKICNLREINPFRHPTTSAESYMGKIRDMVSYLKTDAKRTKNIQSVVEAINERASDLTELNKLQFTLDFVQEPNIRYCVDKESAPLSNIKYEGEYADMELEYMRYPDETLFDKEGDCDCKSFLATMLFNVSGYNVLFLMSDEYKHAAIAVEYNPAWAEQIKDFNEEIVVLEHGGRKYIYCETTGDGYRIGHIKEGEDIHNFEYIVEITK